MIRSSIRFLAATLACPLLAQTVPPPFENRKQKGNAARIDADRHAAGHGEV